MKSPLALLCALAFVISGPAGANAHPTHDHDHEDDDDVVMVDSSGDTVVVADDDDVVLPDDDDVVVVMDDYDEGEVIPVRYLDERYYIDDYRAYHVHAPPRGHRWVRSSASELLLVALATGLVVKALNTR